MAFGDGGAALSIDADCDVAGFAELGATVEGSLSFEEGVSIGTCNIDVDIEGETFDCTCEDDCGDAFSAKATCTQDSTPFFESDCVNVLEIISEVQAAIEDAQSTN